MTGNNRQGVLVAYTDYKKAFDSVCHSKLIHKIKCLWNNRQITIVAQ